MLQYLIAKGADIESKKAIQTKSYNLGEQTPLFIAVVKQKVECVKLLLLHGADMSGLNHMISDDHIDGKS